MESKSSYGYGKEYALELFMRFLCLLLLFYKLTTVLAI